MINRRAIEEAGFKFFAKSFKMSTHREKVKNEGLSTGRIEAFSDAVIAIVITLLVLELKVPQIPEALLAKELPHQLLEMWPKLLSYAISFLVIGIYWVAHHNAFHYARRADRILLWLNMLFLMCLSFIPFPTALIGEYREQPIAVAFYGFTLLVTAAVFTFMWWYIAHGSSLLRPDADPRVIRTVTRGGLSILPLYVVAIIFSFIYIPVSTAIYIFIPAFYIFLNIKWTS